MSNQNLHDEQKRDRDRYSSLIIQSTARNKIIVAGPGTGKSFTFKKFLETKNGDNLAITFINNLASDLQEDLGELSESHTFHGYCKKLLHKISVDGIDANFNYYPKLPLIIESDSNIIGNNLKKFDEAFRTLTEDGRVLFYIEQGNYYNAVSHNDAVYRVLKYFQTDSNLLPKFCQIVVDEYQDFNPLEVAFIEELAKTSPVLIAGDDDQAVYDFRDASPKHVRDKAKKYEKFELPYCSRCTQVIVDAVHDITAKAKTRDKLRDRVDKKYFCFLPDKEEESRKFPKIIHANCSTHTKRAPYISKFIEKEILKISQGDINDAKERGFPCVLIAGPSYYTKQIYDYLKTKFKNINSPKERDKGVDILAGYKLLIRNKESNLGWRIIMECVDVSEKDMIIKEIYKSRDKLCKKLEDSFKNFHLSIVAILKKIKADEKITTAERIEVVNNCGHNFEEIKILLGIENEDEIETREIDASSISIKITTINGSKGLSANYVFLVGMNSTNAILINNSRRVLAGFPFDKNNPSDNEICQFIVGITRTRKKCYLISNYRFGMAYGIQRSDFLDWIDPSRIHAISVNANYFNN